jgi:glycosyltransferase involved in cell wall biosynthesis
LTVVYSEPDLNEGAKGDSINLSVPLGVKVPRLYFVDDRLLLQLPSPKLIASADLVIVVQASGYLLNYLLFALRALGLKRVALWGHGWNRQGDARSWSEWIKRRLAASADWWFAYTKGTASYLVSVGMDPRRITIVDNAIDSLGFGKAVSSVAETDILELRTKLSLSGEERIGLYCGSLYREKRVPLLLEIGEHMAECLPEFRLVVVGGGSEAKLVEEFGRTRRWLRYTGPLFGRDKAVCFRMAEVFINPGGVGVGIIDSFAADLPMLTCKDALHGPEIEYLESGGNGLIIDGDAKAFAQAAVDLLCDSARLARLAQGASRAGKRYTVENMVTNVERGILSCLGVDVGIDGAKREV